MAGYGGLFAKAIMFFRKGAIRDAEHAAEGAGKRSLRENLVGASRDVARDSRVMTRDPIDVASGEVVLHRVDVELPGVLALVVERTHISTYTQGRLFGPSWASTLDQHVEASAGGLSYAAADGMVLTYPPAETGVPAYPLSGPRWPLTRLADGGYSVDDPRSLQTMRFGPSGRLEAIGDRNGNRIDLLLDEAGSPVELRHTGGYRIGVETTDGRITALRLLTADGPGQVLTRYGHDDAGNLAEAFDSSERAQSFRYDDAHRLTAWRDRNGHWYRYGYDALGRGIRGEGEQGVLDTTLRYDPDGRWTAVTDSLGNTTTYHFNDRRRMTRRVDPLGHATVFDWDHRDRMVSRTDPLGHTAHYAYDDAGNLLSLSRPDGRRSHADYDALGLPTRVVEADDAVWRNERDDRGNLTAVVDPLGNTTRYGHDERGAVTSIVDPLGNRTTIEVNAAGLPLLVTDPADSAIAYTYDELGRVSTITDPIGGTARFTWTPEGRPTSRQLPDGTLERWEYDPEGNVVTHTEGAGRTTRTEYGPFATPTAHTGPDGGRLAFGHDTELRLTTVVNPQGLTWRYGYDPAGNLTSEIDFGGRTVGYGHDAAGRLISRADADEHSTFYVRDPLGNTLEKRTADHVTRYEYDPAGRLVRAANPTADLRFERNLLGKVTAETCDGRTLASGYDAAGRRVRRRTPTGALSTWEYDAAGRPSVLVTADQRFEFDYDAAGREVRRRVGAHTVLDQHWDSGHRLLSQELWRGPRTDPSSLVQQRNYVHGQGLDVTATWDRLSGSRRFDLDRVGRVTAVHAQGWTERYAYDAAGDIAHADWPADDASADLLGEREYHGSRLYRAGRTVYGYDERGRTVLRRQRTLSGRERSWRYAWDDEDRLAAAVTPDGQEWRYRYDALGRRVTKQRVGPDGSVAERVDFTWDGEVLVEESHRSGNGHARVTSWDYRPGGFEPIAQYERRVPEDASQEWFDQRFHAIIADAVGSPAELVDTAGDVVWHREASLFGGRRGDRPATRVGCPIGFPGQYHDEETGLAYNRFRYYESGTGRYLSSDPIGLAGGLRPYGYVRNPLTHIDPLGLSEQLPPDMVRIFRTTAREDENRIYQQTGHLMSDAGQKGFDQGGTLQHAFARSQHAHGVNVSALGHEEYSWAHQGGATYALPAHERSMISFTTNEQFALRSQQQYGGHVYSAVVPRSAVNWTTHVGTEREVLVDHMIQATRWR